MAKRDYLWKKIVSSSSLLLRTVQKTGGTVVEAVSATFSCQGTIEAKVIKQKNKEEEEKLKINIIKCKMK